MSALFEVLAVTLGQVMLGRSVDGAETSCNIIRLEFRLLVRTCIALTFDLSNRGSSLAVQLLHLGEPVSAVHNLFQIGDFAADELVT